MLTIVPDSFLNQIKDSQEKIINLLECNSKKPENKFITEKEAKDLLKRKSTWFWQMRKNGSIPFSKVGKSIYYSINDINFLMESNKTK
jgi:hypothetical protein